VEYEFEYLPGKLVVHPSIGQLVFVLEPDGVRLQRLIEDFEPSLGLKTANPIEEKEGRPGPEQLPLRIGQFNQIRLTLNGDTITLRLNGIEIYQRTLEPSHSRIFGFYHESDRSEARIRSVQFQGSWPRSLPKPDELMAAEPGQAPGSK